MKDWILVVVLALGAACVSGLARFSYALVLPAMRADLAWTYAQAGAVGAANSLGYLAGALLILRIVPRAGNRRLFVAGLVITGIALILSSTTREYSTQLLYRALAGVGASGTFVCGGVLAGTLTLVVRGRPVPGLGVTVFFAGGGVGIMASGLVLPLWLAAAGEGSWASAWLAMGLVTLTAAILGVIAVRMIAEPNRSAGGGAWKARAYLPAMLSYFGFGLGYIAYMTFIVAWMRQLGGPPEQVAATWALLGAAIIVAPWVWGARFRRSRGGRPMAEALAVLALGALLPLAFTGTPALLLSAVLVGVSIFMLPAAVQLLLKNDLPAGAWGPAMAAFTVLFAAGQVVGPVVTGWLADVTGSLFAGLALSVVVLAAASIAALFQRPQTSRETSSEAVA